MKQRLFLKRKKSKEQWQYGSLGGDKIMDVLFIIIPIIAFGMYISGQIKKEDKEREEKEKARQFWDNIPNTDLYARLSNNPLARECRKIYTQEDLLKGIIVRKDCVQVGRKTLLYADYGLKELEENEQKILARWLIDYIPKENRPYNWRIKAVFRSIGGSLEPVSYRPNTNGDYVANYGSPPTKKLDGYEAKITFIKEKKPLTDW